MIDLVAGRDFTPDGTIEAAEVRDGDPCPDCATARSTPPAASRWATSSSSAASTPTRSTSRCSTRTASSSPSPWARTASASRARSRPIAENTHDDRRPGLAARGRARRRAPGRDRQGRGASSTTAERLAVELDRARPRRALTTTGRKVSPGVKFKDAELIGVPTIVVVGKGLRRRRRRGQGPGLRRAARTSRGRGRVASDARRESRSATRSRRLSGTRADRGGHLRLGRHADAAGTTSTSTTSRWRSRGGRRRRRTTTRSPRAAAPAGDTVWGRSRDHHRSATVADLFAEAGLEPRRGAARRPTASSGSRTRSPTRTSGRCSSALRGRRDSRSACCPTRSGRAPGTRSSSAATASLDLIDGDVYTSEIPWTKPSPRGVPGGAWTRSASSDPARVRVRRRPALRRRLGRRQRRACAPSTCRTATSRATRSATPRASPTPSCTGSPRCGRRRRWRRGPG